MRRGSKYSIPTFRSYFVGEMKLQIFTATSDIEISFYILNFRRRFPSFILLYLNVRGDIWSYFHLTLTVESHFGRYFRLYLNVRVGLSELSCLKGFFEYLFLLKNFLSLSRPLAEQILRNYSQEKRHSKNPSGAYWME